MSKCDGSCNTIEDPFGRMCISHKVGDVNLKVFKFIKWRNKLKTLAKHISFESRCEFDCKKRNSSQKWDNDKSQCRVKKPIRHGACEEKYICNLSTCPCRCDKDDFICEYLKTVNA